MSDLINAKPILASLIFAVIGVVVLVVSFWLVDKLTPHSLWKEIIEKRNTALAILAGCFMLSLGLIVAASIHG